MMKFVTVRELRANLGGLRKDLAAQDELVVTSNGKPVALLSSIDEGSLEDSLAALRRSRAMMAVSEMQRASVAAGRDTITSEEIDEEIAAVRRQRRRGNE